MKKIKKIIVNGGDVNVKYPYIGSKVCNMIIGIIVIVHPILVVPRVQHVYEYSCDWHDSK